MPLPADFLLPVQQAANAAADRAADHAASTNVLAARTEAEVAEALAVAARRQLKGLATDKALRLTVQKLDSLQPGEGNLDTLVRVVTALDPDQQQAAGNVVQVAVVFRQEGRQQTE